MNILRGCFQRGAVPVLGSLFLAVQFSAAYAKGLSYSEIALAEYVDKNCAGLGLTDTGRKKVRTLRDRKGAVINAELDDLLDRAREAMVMISFENSNEETVKQLLCMTGYVKFKNTTSSTLIKVH